MSAGGQPFIKMTLDEKRKIIDNITNLSDTKEYAKITKNAMSESLSRVSVIESEIGIHKSSLVPYLEILKKNNDEIDDRISEINISIIRSQNEMNVYEQKVDELTIELDTLNNELSDIVNNEKIEITEYNKNNPKKLQDEIVDHNSTLKYLKQKVTEKKHELTKIQANIPCDNCGNCYTEDQANNKRSEKQLEINELIAEGKETKAKLDLVNDIVIKFNDQITKIRAIQGQKSNTNYSIQAKKHEITIVTNNISFIKSGIHKYEDEITRLTTAKKDSETALKTQDKIDVLNLKISDLQKELAELKDKIEAYKYMIKMFSDDGIKSFILNKFLPILNKLINYYLKIFNISVYLELTSDYNYTMKSSNGLADDYEGLSGGQQQRINLAILFAQTDLIKIIGNFKTNILFLDEFIDGAIDHEGLMDTLKIMKQISLRDNKSIVFISHRLDSNLIRDIDNFYMANKVDSDFSDFSKVESDDVMQIINQN